MSAPAAQAVEWDGEARSLLRLVNDMLVESGITDRRFVATDLSNSKVKIGMEFSK